MKKQARDDEKFRSRIEGKLRMKSRRENLGMRFTKHGEAKRRFSLNRVMTKLSETSKTAIAITFLVMNLSTLLRQFFAFFCIFLRMNAFFVIFEVRSLIKIRLDSNQILIVDGFNLTDR